MTYNVDLLNGNEIDEGKNWMDLEKKFLNYKEMTQKYILRF